jgi:two-component system, OmpR family, sensor histidine kinase MtrB
VARRSTARSGGAIHSEVPAGLVVEADRLRVEQALVNLVDNAMRHGRPPVTLSAAEHPDRLELHVTDEGPGFAGESGGGALPHVGAGRGGGFGLGLAIVGSIGRAHGGGSGVANTEGGADAWIALAQAPQGAPRVPSR